MAKVSIHGGISKVEMDQKNSPHGLVTWVTLIGNNGDDVTFFMDGLYSIETLAHKLLSGVKQFKEEQKNG